MIPTHDIELTCLADEGYQLWISKGSIQRSAIKHQLRVSSEVVKLRRAATRGFDDTEPSCVLILRMKVPQCFGVTRWFHDRVHQLDQEPVFFDMWTPIEVRLIWAVLYLLGPTFLAEGGSTSRAEKRLEIGAIAALASCRLSHL